MELASASDEPSIPAAAVDGTWLECIECGETSPPFDAIRYTCERCSSLLEVRYETITPLASARGDGVWRYASTLPVEAGVTIQEGATPLYHVPTLESVLDVDTLRIKHEGMNPTGSFKDRGMTVGVEVARTLGVDRLVCASTGNTSASLAAYGSRAGLETVVLLPRGKVASGKVAQASLHGARILEVDGNFDACLDIVKELANRGEAYLLNSLNPFRLEGQKTIGLEIVEAFLKEYGMPPDRIVLPVGNAGNTAALYKAFRELVRAGDLAIDDVPALTGIQAEGAAPIVEAIESGATEIRRWEDVETTATAIRIGNPVNAPKALPGIRETGGTAIAVSDEDISAAQRNLAAEGIGVEPASASTIAGVKRLTESGVIEPDERVVCLTTGHLLKDPEAAAEAGTDAEPVPADTESVIAHLES